ncbi:hypothetical protein ND861_09690 [Leptospira sp. 2 VSF19]|uniref:Uncharacterized protein n=1 Tax=Leptospira soteropolitanensis TaxID=2950025 RepID=A0AAW5VG26_9LEPT|nr:hypothetical protein [Leptospira soteropolitanensis]MCW7492522.1 hypothetical protein [Leptospira soteropolitanensis]MCW7500571.1 hypothetical protein [Leptospira soteropolitanensis]MCW7522759.1 hypothetical protein [Leptospira soteropolitanensis]MCW7526616.1 hypothetical protein [Leptospira soteropolitanensis]MCW7530541.1 hypothetical protein [Leptospira soteropolitanensis]
MSAKNFILLSLCICVFSIYTTLNSQEENKKDFGNLSFKNGSIYRGEHDGSIPDGEGVYIAADLSVIKGTFKKGVLVGHGISINDLDLKFPQDYRPYKAYQIMVGMHSEKGSILDGARIESIPNNKIIFPKGLGKVVVNQIKLGSSIDNTIKSYEW